MIRYRCHYMGYGQTRQFYIFRDSSAKSQEAVHVILCKGPMFGPIVFWVSPDGVIGPGFGVVPIRALVGPFQDPRVCVSEALPDADSFIMSIRHARKYRIVRADHHSVDVAGGEVPFCFQPEEIRFMKNSASTVLYLPVFINTRGKIGGDDD